MRISFRSNTKEVTEMIKKKVIVISQTPSLTGIAMVSHIILNKYVIIYTYFCLIMFVFIRKDTDARKIWRQKEKRVAEDEMIR